MSIIHIGHGDRYVDDHEVVIIPAQNLVIRTWGGMEYMNGASLYMVSDEKMQQLKAATTVKEVDDILFPPNGGPSYLRELAPGVVSAKVDRR